MPHTAVIGPRVHINSQLPPLRSTAIGVDRRVTEELVVPTSESAPARDGTSQRDDKAVSAWPHEKARLAHVRGTNTFRRARDADGYGFCEKSGQGTWGDIQNAESWAAGQEWQ